MKNEELKIKREKIKMKECEEEEAGSVEG